AVLEHYRGRNGIGDADDPDGRRRLFLQVDRRLGQRAGLENLRRQGQNGEQNEQRQRQTKRLSGAAAAQQGIDLVLIALLGRGLQSQLVAARRIFGGLVLIVIAFKLRTMRPRRDYGIKAEGIAESKARRPERAARGGGQQRPQAANERRVRRRPLEGDPA